MDILSLIALSKANKALKNGGGSGEEEHIHIYDFTVTGSSGNFTVTTDVDYQDIISDINNGYIPIAHINRGGGSGMYAMLDQWSEADFSFAPYITVDATFGVTEQRLIHYHMDGIFIWEYLEHRYEYIAE